jgi:hypothetical protein
MSITDTLIELTRDEAQSQTERGVELLPVPGTLLASYFESINTHTLEPRPELQVEQKVVADVARVLTNVVRTVREIGEATQQIVTAVSSELQRNGVTDENPYEIITVPTSAVYNEPMLETIIQKYGHVEYASSGTGVGAIVDADSVQAMAKITEVTAAIANDVTMLETVVGYVNGNVPLPEQTDNIESVYLTHMVAHQLYDNPPANYTGATLEQYNEWIAYLIEQSARLISRLHERELRESRMDSLYIERFFPNNAKKLIVVRESVYLGALDKGLTPEALIANEMKGRAVRSTDELIEQAAALQEEYNRLIRIRRTEQEDAYFDQTWQVARKVLREFINAYCDQNNVNEATQIRAHEFCQKCISEWSYVDNQLETTVGRCIAYSLWGHTHVPQAFNLLITKDNGLANLKDTMTDVLVDLVYTWISTQIQTA